MVALRSHDHAASHGGTRSNCTYEAHRRASLIERMSGMYWRVAHPKQVKAIRNIGAIIRQDLQLFPNQCQEAVKHLSALREAAHVVHNFYSSLDPYAMKAVRPWGTLTQLSYLDDQVTELLLLLDAFTPICTEPSYARVQLQLIIRHLYPLMLITFEATMGQLAALVEKTREQQDQERRGGAGV